MDTINSANELTKYMSRAIETIIENALKSTLSNPRESAFLLKFAASAKSAAKLRSRFEEQGTHIPPFLIASITSQCNLFCKGCYARANHSCGENSESPQLTEQQWAELFHEASELGISFILLAGGEPLMRRDVIEQAAKVKKVLFPLFTNGTMIDEAFLDFLHVNRHIVPILSMEGNAVQTDSRRGQGIHRILDTAMRQMKQKEIFYGVSVTVTTENIDIVTGEDFHRDLFEHGCKVVFFVEYVPVTAETMPLALADKERETLEKRQRELRNLFEGMLFLSFPGDEKAVGGCLAAGRGFFHINANGGAEPCPFSPYSDTNVKENGLLSALNSPLFQRLQSSDVLLLQHSGGCVLFENKETVGEICQSL